MAKTFRTPGNRPSFYAYLYVNEKPVGMKNVVRHQQQLWILRCGHGGPDITNPIVELLSPETQESTQVQISEVEPVCLAKLWKRCRCPTHRLFERQRLARQPVV